MGNRRKNKKPRGRGGAGQNRSAGEAYRTKNRKRPEVTETPSGLQYTVREEGAGKQPDEWSTVEVNQRILLVDGTVIKDTYHGVENGIKVYLIEMKKFKERFLRIIFLEKKLY